MFKAQKKVVTSTTVTTTITLSAQNIRELLKTPAKASVNFVVPGGGDWSGEKIHLSEKPTAPEAVIEVTWSDQENKTD